VHPCRKDTLLRDARNEDVGRQQVGGEESRAELARCHRLSGAVFRAAFRGDLLDQKPDVFDGERGPIVTEGNVCVRAFQVRLDMHLYLAADARVFGVLDQLPHPTFGYRRRRIHVRA
jgi:hypothetical protein